MSSRSGELSQINATRAHFPHLPGQRRARPIVAASLVTPVHSACEHQRNSAWSLRVTQSQFRSHNEDSFCTCARHPAAGPRRAREPPFGRLSGRLAQGIGGRGSAAGPRSDVAGHSPRNNRRPGHDRRIRRGPGAGDASSGRRRCFWPCAPTLSAAQVSPRSGVCSPPALSPPPQRDVICWSARARRHQAQARWFHQRTGPERDQGIIMKPLVI
jgi:hypothetical protein